MIKLPKENYCLTCEKASNCINFGKEDISKSCANCEWFEAINIMDEIDMDIDFELVETPEFEEPNGLTWVPNSPTSKLDKVVSAKDKNLETVSEYKKRVCVKCPVFIEHDCKVFNEIIKKENYDHLAKDFFNFQYCFEALDRLHFRDLN